MPLEVSPETVSVLGNQVVDFSTNGVGVLWTCSTGTITSGGVWTPFNRTHQATIRVWNGSEAVFATGLVTGVFPLISYNQSARKTKKSVAKVDIPSGITYAAARSGTRLAYELSAFERPWIVEQLRDFWSWHYPDKEFVLDDKITGQMRRFRFDGQLQTNERGSNSTDWSVPVLAVSDSEQPFSLTVVLGGLNATAQWLYAGVSPNRCEYREVGDVDWTPIGDWSDQRQASVELEESKTFEFRAVAQDGGLSPVVTVMTGGAGWGQLWDFNWGGGA
jgi:hypothetical protein